MRSLVLTKLVHVLRKTSIRREELIEVDLGVSRMMSDLGLMDGDEGDATAPYAALLVLQMIADDALDTSPILAAQFPRGFDAYAHFDTGDPASVGLDRLLLGAQGALDAVSCLNWFWSLFSLAFGLSFQGASGRVKHRGPEALLDPPCE